MTLSRLLPFLAILPLFVLTACGGSGWFGGDDDKAPLPGERLSILELQKQVQPEMSAEDAEPFVTPAPWMNDFWPQAGGYPNHDMQNLALNSGALSRVWSADIGSGSSKSLPLTAQPVVADGRVYTLDTDSKVSAFSIENGKQIWRTDVSDPKEEDEVISGGVSFANGVVYVTAGFDELLALKADNGEIIWRTSLKAPSRAAPTVLNDRVFVSTLNSSTLALDAASGQVLWEYSSIGEAAGLLGAASPAANSSIVVAAYSSGELVALRVENGSVAWSENLSGALRLGGLSGLSDIRGLPVINKDLVIAISFGGKMSAIEESSGDQVWQKEITGAETPWVAGDNVFVLTTDNEVVALQRNSGAIRWVTQMKQYKNEESRSGPIFWTGPVMAGGRLIISGTGGRIAELDPASGKLLRQWDMGKNIRISPVVAGETLYLLSDDGTLMAYR